MFSVCYLKYWIKGVIITAKQLAFRRSTMAVPYLHDDRFIFLQKFVTVVLKGTRHGIKKYLTLRSLLRHGLPVPRAKIGNGAPSSGGEGKRNRTNSNTYQNECNVCGMGWAITNGCVTLQWTEEFKIGAQLWEKVLEWVVSLEGINAIPSVVWLEGKHFPVSIVWMEEKMSLHRWFHWNEKMPLHQWCHWKEKYPCMGGKNVPTLEVPFWEGSRSAYHAR